MIVIYLQYILLRPTIGLGVVQLIIISLISTQKAIDGDKYCGSTFKC